MPMRSSLKKRGGHRYNIVMLQILYHLSLEVEDRSHRNHRHAIVYRAVSRWGPSWYTRRSVFQRG